MHLQEMDWLGCKNLKQLAYKHARKYVPSPPFMIIIVHSGLATCQLFFNRSLRRPKRMCIKCDLRKRSETIKPVYIFLQKEDRAAASLPPEWQELEAKGFYPDLVERARAHAAYAAQRGRTANAQATLAVIGHSFAVRFDTASYPNATNPLSRQVLAALDELADFYGDRVPSIVWHSFAHIALRENPTEEQSILREAGGGKLPAHYTIVDSCLHAAGLVYTFMLHVQSVFQQRTGMVLNHNCDCNCSLVSVEACSTPTMAFSPARSNVAGMTASLLTHLLAETWKLQEDCLPFAYGISEESAAIQALLKPRGRFIAESV
ncbi:hypothetical protein K2Q16_02495 [Patescibacteria group bacterium]|nr:hypothetical protein [Patescibacteria group bacterium]